jgi:hypothetical protein
MAVTAADGIFGYAPQVGKEVMPASPTWFRHKASLVDLGVNDDQRTGQLEVGGGPFPTFPYKAGYLVGGGATFQPRLQDVLGWIFYAGMGDIKSSTPVPGTDVHAEITVATPPHSVTTAITAPPAGGAQVAIEVGTPTGASMTAEIHVNGTDNDDDALEVIYTVTARAALAVVVGGTMGVFKTVTSIDVVSGTTGDKFTPIYLTGITHSFIPKTSSKSHVKWLAARKYIPQKDGDALTDLLESYTDCKPLGMTFTLPNDSPLTMRMDMMGRTFELGDDISSWTWANEYEDWDSIPVGCETDGYIKFTGGGLSGEELPVVGAQISMINTPLDPRQERVYGSPKIEDITIVSRQMTYSCTVKWNNPELYRAVLTGDHAGTAWSSRPLTGSMDVRSVATGFISGSQKYMLNVSSPEILWMMNGTPVLAAGQAVICQFTGIALAPSVGDYTTFALTNNVLNYTWPVA